ncbi:transposase [Castellaniella sp. S9]|uniref:transposase n=1 Tax=Castellaniella sp. S9 TaxID=2993652 RepID=UPI003FA42A9C
MSDVLLPMFYSRQDNAEERARQILETYRWPDGQPCCPECNSRRPIYRQTRDGAVGYYRCPNLHSPENGTDPGKPLVFTVRTRTILARSHVPLDKWLYCFQLLSQPSGARGPLISATDLANRINVNRKTASSLLEQIDQLRYGHVLDEDKNEFLLRMMAQMTRQHIFPTL